MKCLDCGAEPATVNAQFYAHSRDVCASCAVVALANSVPGTTGEDKPRMERVARPSELQTASLTDPTPGMAPYPAELSNARQRCMSLLHEALEQPVTNHRRSEIVHVVHDLLAQNQNTGQGDGSFNGAVYSSIRRAVDHLGSADQQMRYAVLELQRMGQFPWPRLDARPESTDERRVTSGATLSTPQRTDPI